MGTQMLLGVGFHHCHRGSILPMKSKKLNSAIRIRGSQSFKPFLEVMEHMMPGKTDMDCRNTIHTSMAGPLVSHRTLRTAESPYKSDRSSSSMSASTASMGSGGERPSALSQELPPMESKRVLCALLMSSSVSSDSPSPIRMILGGETEVPKAEDVCLETGGPNRGVRSEGEWGLGGL